MCLTGNHDVELISLPRYIGTNDTLCMNISLVTTWVVVCQAALETTRQAKNTNGWRIHIGEKYTLVVIARLKAAMT